MGEYIVFPKRKSDVLYGGKHGALITDADFYYDPIAKIHKAWIDFEVNDGKRCNGKYYRKWFCLKTDAAWQQLFNELSKIGVLLVERKSAKSTMEMLIGRQVKLSVVKNRGEKKVFIAGNDD